MVIKKIYLKCVRAFLIYINIQHYKSSVICTFDFIPPLILNYTVVKIDLNYNETMTLHNPWADSSAHDKYNVFRTVLIDI